MNNNNRDKYIYKLDEYDNEKIINKICAGLSSNYDGEYIDSTINDMENANSDLAAQARQMLLRYKPNQ